MTFSIPAHKCGLVIGRGGESVKSINQQTGAFVEISRQPPPNGDPNFKLFTIRGSPQQIDHAKQLIEEKIEVRWRLKEQLSKATSSFELILNLSACFCCV